MTDAERQRLARILGMLGSEHAGERASAGLQAEAFRKRHGLTWEEMIQGKTVYLGGAPPWAKSDPDAGMATPQAGGNQEPPPPPRAASHEAARPANMADAWFTRVRAKEAARSSAPPWPYPLPPRRPVVSTIEEWRATFAPEPSRTKDRWLAVSYFGACAVVLFACLAFAR